MHGDTSHCPAVFLPCSRFLQGAGTDPATVAQIRDAVKSGAELTVRILNYTKSGRPFWNMFTLAPMRDSDGHARFYVGVQVGRLARMMRFFQSREFRPFQLGLPVLFIMEWPIRLPYYSASRREMILIIVG
jgi:hypothetical protein